MNKAAAIALFLGWCCYTMSAYGQTSPWSRDEARSVTGLGEATFTQRVSPNAVGLLMAQRVESVDWSDQTFEDVLNWLRDQGDGRINIVIRWNQLAVEGITRDSLIANLQLMDTTVGDVLKEVGLQLSEDGQIRFHGTQNKLVISTASDFDRTLYTKVYNVTDILHRVPNFGQSAPLIDLQQTGQSGGGGGGGGGGGQSVFGGAGGGGGGQEQEEGGQQAEQDLEQRMKKLADMIQQTIAPESWDFTGTGVQQPPGAAIGRGRIRVFNQTLVVTNTIEVHEMIVGRFAFGD